MWKTDIKVVTILNKNASNTKISFISGFFFLKRLLNFGILHTRYLRLHKTWKHMTMSLKIPLQ